MRGGRHAPYHDGGGVLTTCYGHTGTDVVSTRRYTEEECRSLLDSDVSAALSVVEHSVTASLNENQKAALASFVYNVDGGEFSRSTLLKKLNTGDIPGACDEMRRWVYVDGRVWKGLVSRRNVERELCLQGQP
jgi:lysozyme